jgi:uncharacterized protein YcbX
MSDIRVVGLFIYPVKSLGGFAVTSTTVTDRGLAEDRRWMVVDETGKFLTQRQHPTMATLRVVPHEEGGGRFTIADPSGHAVTIGSGIGDPVEVTVWRDQVQARPVSVEADDLLTRHLGLRCRLVHMGDDSHRQVDPRYAPPGRITSLADGYPVLIASTSSLADLNGRMDKPVPMSRFRPNIVVEGSLPFAEDGWGTLRIGTAEFEAVKPCSRCIMTTIDQDTGEKTGKEPLKTLAKFRNTPDGVIFGENLLISRPGMVGIGDMVEFIAPRRMAVG